MRLPAPTRPAPDLPRAIDGRDMTASLHSVVDSMTVACGTHGGKETSAVGRANWRSQATRARGWAGARDGHSYRQVATELHCSIRIKVAGDRIKFALSTVFNRNWLKFLTGPPGQPPRPLYQSRVRPA